METNTFQLGDILVSTMLGSTAINAKGEEIRFSMREECHAYQVVQRDKTTVSLRELMWHRYTASVPRLPDSGKDPVMRAGSFGRPVRDKFLNTHVVIKDVESNRFGQCVCWDDVVQTAAKYHLGHGYPAKTVIT
jgi:hypothetical protein